MLTRHYRLSSISMFGLLGVVLLFTMALVAKPVQAAVLWDQPLSVVNQYPYIDQDFPNLPTYSSFLADDFTNPMLWYISTMFVPGGGWNNFSTLFNATALTFQIYGNSADVPDGDPSGGGNPPFWTLTLPLVDPQISITPGTPGSLPSDVTLDLTTDISLPAGDWWFIFYPTMVFPYGGQYGRQPSDTTNGYFGQFINPGGGFSLGTNWQPWTILDPIPPQDIAFRLEGEPIPEPTTMLLLGSGLIGLAGYGRKKLFEK